MARKKRQEEHENHERWLVSYADFITLLFAFFVVMYSISSVNEGKYRVLSDTLTEAFVSPTRSMDPIQIGEPVRSLVPVSGEHTGSAVQANVDDQTAIEQEDNGEDIAETGAFSLAELATSLEGALGPLIDKELVKVTETERGIEVEINSKMLFKSGSAKLSREALKTLWGIARIIKPLPNSIRVEGHTDNVPINTAAFPSNWELSASRAASVVHLFARRGVDSGRMAAIGYGQFRPIADNDSAEGRQKNRRVALVIMASKHQREALDLGTPSKQAAR